MKTTTPKEELADEDFGGGECWQRRMSVDKDFLLPPRRTHARRNNSLKEELNVLSRTDAPEEDGCFQRRLKDASQGGQMPSRRTEAS